jgi:hypothetical protein
MDVLPVILMEFVLHVTEEEDYLLLLKVLTKFAKNALLRARTANIVKTMTTLLV